MIERKPLSTARGGARTAAFHQVNLLRVEGRTLTVLELAKELGKTATEIRARIRQLIHHRRPYTLDDFRG